MDEETLKKDKTLYKLFNSSITKDRLANSYILYGDLNSPLKDTALYLAKSLSCEKSTFACNNCNSCKRFDLGKTVDSYFIDGSIDTIKKEDIKNLESHFKYATLEKNHTSTYVINAINNITDEAANALLKFLEEPKYKLIAFLTTNNPTLVLKTIVSRSTLVLVESTSSKELYNQLLNTPFINDKKEIRLSSFSSFLLSKMVPSVSDAKNLISLYDLPTLFDEVESFFNELVSDIKLASYQLLSIPTKIKDTKSYYYLMLSLSIIFSELISGKISSDSGLDDVLKTISISKSKIGKIKSVLEEYNGLRTINLDISYFLSKIVLLLKEK